MRHAGKCAPGALIGRTFRLQFRAEADAARGVWAGRVEHLRSGDAAHFTRLDELLSFVALWLSREEIAQRAGGAGEGRTSA